ncbi:aliphatic sulfonate ABC transporter substrate-binding protein [Bradyrhizobium sp. SYSU BS000235]|uniref:aliphatic sulfonate ABC transporter substrate-binding protein n=1 Tax=Bradyrhizobium sp. SYSU BS000235 TaxID=3411332 RepID=UPI003C71E69D
MDRRTFLMLTSLATAASAMTPAVLRAQGVNEVRIGYQKTGLLVIARQRGVLEKRLGSEGPQIKWVEFTSGPPLLEAISNGSLDFGAVGDSPPIFAQAANANIVYAASSPISNGQGILVSQGSSIKAISDLRGKRVGFTKGSSANNVVLLTLEKAGLTYADITPVYLTPPDAGPAFANGSIDAWAVWDPYFAIGETKQNARILINAHEVGKTNAFFIANRDFANKRPGQLSDIIAGLATAAEWAESHRGDVAKSLHEITGVPLDIQTVAANRATFAIGPVTEEVIQTQQRVADGFQKLGLIPRQIKVRDIVWRAPQT